MYMHHLDNLYKSCQIIFLIRGHLGSQGSNTRSESKYLLKIISAMCNIAHWYLLHIWKNIGQCCLGWHRFGVKGNTIFSSMADLQWKDRFWVKTEEKGHVLHLHSTKRSTVYLFLLYAWLGGVNFITFFVPLKAFNKNPLCILFTRDVFNHGYQISN